MEASRYIDNERRLCYFEKSPFKINHMHLDLKDLGSNVAYGLLQENLLKNLLGNSGELEKLSLHPAKTSLYA